LHMSGEPNEAQHYYSKKPRKSTKRFSMSLDIKGRHITLASCGGVFSKSKVDLGTIVLLEALSLPKQGDVLDMGCGCGVIGISLAVMRPSIDVTMVDVNPIAVKLAKENIESNGIENAAAFQSDIYCALAGRTFDVIVSNPPLAAGYKVIYPMIEGALDHLKEGGSLQIVLRKGVNAIPKKMGDIFGNVELISRKSGYKVFRSVKKCVPKKQTEPKV